METYTHVTAGEEELQSLAIWAHQKCGHLEEKATYRWAIDRETALILCTIEDIISQCPVCHHLKPQPLPQVIKGQIERGK